MNKEKEAQKYIARIKSKTGNVPAKHRSYAVEMLRVLKANDFDWGFAYAHMKDYRKKIGLADTSAKKIERDLRKAMDESVKLDKNQLRKVIREELMEILKKDRNRAFRLIKKVLGKDMVSRDEDGNIWLRGPMSRESAKKIAQKVSGRVAGVEVKMINASGGSGYGLQIVKAGLSEARLGDRTATINLEKIAYSLLEDAEKKIKTPRGFGGFQVAWSERAGNIDLLFDTPREIRHENEYLSLDHIKMKEWNKLDRLVFQLLGRYRELYPGVNFGQVGEVFGAGIKTSGRVRSSTF